MGSNVTTARCWIMNTSWVSTSHRLVWCVHVCVFSLSSLSLLLFLFPLRSGGSNVCYYFFYTWPCLFGRTYQRRLVGASLPLPAFLPVWPGPVWSNACRQPCTFILFCFFPLSFCLFSFSLMTGMDGLYLSLSFSSIYYPTSLCSLPAPPPPSLLFGAPHRSPSLCTFIGVWDKDRWVETKTKWNKKVI